MTKLLIFLGLIFGVFYFFYHRFKKFLGELFQPPQTGPGPNPGQTGPGGARMGRIDKGEMIKCPACEVYFPAGTGVRAGGKEYCSDDCRTKGA